MIFMKKILKQIKACLLVSCISLSLTAVQAQDPGAVKAAFEKYISSTPMEKVYAHTDRAFYMTGEILWFKLYTVDAGNNKPMDMSKVAYVDVLDSANNTILQAKVGLKGGLGS